MHLYSWPHCNRRTINSFMVMMMMMMMRAALTTSVNSSRPCHAAKAVPGDSRFRFCQCVAVSSGDISAICARIWKVIYRWIQDRMNEINFWQPFFRVSGSLNRDCWYLVGETAKKVFRCFTKHSKKKQIAPIKYYKLASLGRNLKPGGRVSPAVGLCPH